MEFHDFEERESAGRFKQFIGDSIRAWGARDRFVKNKKTYMYKLAFNYLNGYRNFIYKMDKNGEESLLDRLNNLGDDRPKIFFDIGANIGEWSNLVARKYPVAEIHCFEMCPKTYENLRKNTGEYGICCHNIAMSDKDIEEFNVNCRGNNHKRNSIEMPLEDSSDRVTVKMASGDIFCEENGIDEIDFLKIDVEGHELMVLKGFGNMIKGNKIKLIQFELNEYGMNRGITLGCFLDFFGEKYKVGKIYPNHIDFEMKDRFKFWESSPNYIAVPENGSLYGHLKTDR